jgi:hypothetical protein
MVMQTPYKVTHLIVMQTPYKVPPISDLNVEAPATPKGKALNEDLIIMFAKLIQQTLCKISIEPLSCQYSYNSSMHTNRLSSYQVSLAAVCRLLKFSLELNRLIVFSWCTCVHGKLSIWEPEFPMLCRSKPPFPDAHNLRLISRV